MCYVYVHAEYATTQMSKWPYIIIALHIYIYMPNNPKTSSLMIQSKQILWHVIRPTAFPPSYQLSVG
jgi:hypothetical protein